MIWIFRLDQPLVFKPAVEVALDPKTFFSVAVFKDAPLEAALARGKDSGQTASPGFVLC